MKINLQQYLDKNTYTIIFMLSAVILTSGMLYILNSGNLSPVDLTGTAPTLEKHGCDVSAGYLWCGPKTKCVRQWEEGCYSGPDQELKYSLAEQYGRMPHEVSIAITNINDNYLVGTVYMSDSSGRPSPKNGLLLATKMNKPFWFVVHQGNGAVDCALMKNSYNFPDEFLKGSCN